jgi:hypothetical protein
MEGRDEPQVWSFLVVRPMSEADVRTVEAPPLKVHEVVDRLMKIERQRRRRAP